MSIPHVGYSQTKEELMGKNNLKDTAKWAVINNQYVLRDVCNAFIKMYDAAKKDGVNLVVVSGYRSYDRQKQIWDRKWNAANLRGATDKQKVLKILEYSSIPGTSRHHWGTDIDINSVESAYFDQPAGKKVYKWLEANARKFGFFQPYTAGRSKGYSEEKWHWSYAPLSHGYLKKYLLLVDNDLILKGVRCSHIHDIQIIENWVKL